MALPLFDIMAHVGMPAVGIDLGTTYSAVARIDETGRPVTLVNSEGDLVTPSVVLFENNQAVVGKEALKALSTDAQHVAQLAKRELGSREFHQRLRGHQYPPEVLQALVLNKLRKDASRIIGDFNKVVITVPAYFDEVRRKATQDAGFIAGFEVLDIINEPTAAAMAHGFLKGFLNRKGESNDLKRLLVYDLGGGTFDVTVMEILGHDFRALATDGDVELGGYDWDRRLVDYVARAFMMEHKTDPRKDPNTAGRLWRECEDAKRTLSVRERTSISCDYKGMAVRTEITRDKFEEITQDLLVRTEFTTKRTLQASGLQWSDLDYVLLVGGSTRMPMVSKLLRHLSGKEPDGSVAVDEAVAHGAALHAAILLTQGQGQKPLLSITNVNSHSLGVVATDTATKRKRNATVIPRNTPLPVTARRIFRTQKARQKSILVQIVEGENPSPLECSQIGQCTVRDLPDDLPAQTPIEVEFAYQANGRLMVNVRVQGTPTELHHEITRENSMSREELLEWRELVTQGPGALEASKNENLTIVMDDD